MFLSGFPMHNYAIGDVCNSLTVTKCLLNNMHADTLLGLNSLKLRMLIL